MYILESGQAEVTISNMSLAVGGADAAIFGMEEYLGISEKQLCTITISQYSRVWTVPRERFMTALNFYPITQLALRQHIWTRLMHFLKIVLPCTPFGESSGDLKDITEIRMLPSNGKIIQADKPLGGLLILVGDIAKGQKQLDGDEAEINKLDFDAGMRPPFADG